MGHQVWKGPSMFDGTPLAVDVGALETASKNPKTGDMAQVAFLPADRDEDAPNLTMRMRNDMGSACPPECALWETCYAWRGQPAIAAASMRRSAAKHPLATESLPPLRKPLRIGMLGDPGSAAASVTHSLVAWAVKNGQVWTGYTAAWRRYRVRGLRRYLMASVQSAADRLVAKSQGWRTARTVPRVEWEAHGLDVLEPGEILCPATPEGGSRTNCANCHLCDGHRAPYNMGKFGPLVTDRRKDVVFIAHGPAA